MPAKPAPKPAVPRARAWAGWGAAGLLALAALLAYADSFGGPFVFDDVSAIVKNSTLRHLWPLTEAFSPPDNGETVSGRPLLNFSFALNYAAGGDAVGGYHAVNLAIHIAAGLLLLGVLRRSLRLPIWRARYDAAAWPLALTVALLWTLHPLQTESVTYIAQRAESLAGMFYLLTLYCFIRATEWEDPDRAAAPRGGGRWLAAAVAACLLGMACKETLATAPLLVLLYDRNFLAGSWREAWRRRRRFYLALAAAWLWLGWLVAGAGNRGGSAGPGTAIGWTDYLMTQCHAVLKYIELSFWPGPLVFDYGTGVVTGAGRVVAPALLLALLAAGVVYALRRTDARARAAGFLGAWFLIILAPSSSIVPVATQTMAEHRMYLPLAAVLAGAVLALHAWIGRRAIVVGLAGAAVCGWLTAQRNHDYRSALALWSDTAAKVPDQPRAHHNVGFALSQEQDYPGAIQEFQRALQLDPTDADAQVLLGSSYFLSGHPAASIAPFQAALRLRPDDAEARYDLANAYFQTGDYATALTQVQAALRLIPQSAIAHDLLGKIWSLQNRWDDAAAEFQLAVKDDPANADAHFNLGVVFFKLSRDADAIAQFRAALPLDPKNATLHYNLAQTLLRAGDFPAAAGELDEVLRLQPDYPGAREKRATVNLLLGP